MSRVIHYERCPRCAKLGLDTRADNLGVYSDGGAHCFSCGFHKFPKGVSNWREPINVNKNLLPTDFTREVPSRALQWLIQFGLGYNYWKESIGYSPSEERLVFTVGNPVSFSIGRYVGSKEGVRKWYVWGDPHKHCEVIGQGDIVVLVEDLISAHKVASAGFISIPLFGTKLHPCHIYYLQNTLKTTILWLDRDKEFFSKRYSLQIGSLLNRIVRAVTTEKDPKCLSSETIQQVITQP